MSTRHIHLHIGTHKTASTTIQAGCVRNKAVLEAAGYLYPVTGMYIYGQHNIAWEMAQGHPQPWNHVSSWVAYRENGGNLLDLIKEIDLSGIQNIILSSEDFDGLHTSRIRRLREQLSGFDVDVIVYLREQLSLWQSAWAQFIKSGYVTACFQDWAIMMLDAPPHVQRYFGRYDLFLQPWAEVFGQAHVHVRRYGVDAYGGTIFADFLNTCGITDHSGFFTPGNENISPGYPVLELSRVMGSRFADPNVRNRICSLVQEHAQANGWGKGRFQLADADLARRVRQFFQLSNTQTSHTYLGLDELFPLPADDHTGVVFSLDVLDPTALAGLEDYLDKNLPKVS